MTSNPKKQAAKKQDGSTFNSLEEYVAEVKRLLFERSELRKEWVETLVQGDMHYLERAFQKNEVPVAAAFEIYFTEEESAREPVPEDCRLRVDLNEKARSHLQKLVDIGLWGDSAESVASTLIQQQLEDKLKSGLLGKVGVL
jgi:hypothetical protein